MSEEQAVLAANAAFYAALAAGDYAAMDRLWADAAPVACIHPGWPILVGREAVMDSWRRILATPPGIACADAACHAIPGPDPGTGTAYVTCMERIGPALLAATNLFVREQGQWRIAHHQAGHVLETEAAPAPLPGSDPGLAPPRGRLH